jgi:hypothetical protein
VIWSCQSLCPPSFFTLSSTLPLLIEKSKHFTTTNRKNQGSSHLLNHFCGKWFALSHELLGSIRGLAKLFLTFYLLTIWTALKSSNYERKCHGRWSQSVTITCFKLWWLIIHHRLEADLWWFLVSICDGRCCYHHRNVTHFGRLWDPPVLYNELLYIITDMLNLWCQR